MQSIGHAYPADVVAPSRKPPQGAQCGGVGVGVGVGTGTGVGVGALHIYSGQIMVELTAPELPSTGQGLHPVVPVGSDDPPWKVVPLVEFWLGCPVVCFLQPHGTAIVPAEAALALVVFKVDFDGTVFTPLALL